MSTDNNFLMGIIEDLGKHMIEILKQKQLPQRPSDAHEVMSLVSKLMQETIDYFSAGRFALHAVWIKDNSNRIFSPEVALHLMSNKFADTKLYPCVWCGISLTSPHSLTLHMDTDHKSAMQDDLRQEYLVRLQQQETARGTVSAAVSKTVSSARMEFNPSDTDTIIIGTPAITKRKRDSVVVDLIDDIDTDEAETKFKSSYETVAKSRRVDQNKGIKKRKADSAVVTQAGNKSNKTATELKRKETGKLESRGALAKLNRIEQVSFRDLQEPTVKKHKKETSEEEVEQQEMATFSCSTLEGEKSDGMKSFHCYSNSLLECLRQEEIQNGPTEARIVVDFCKDLTDAAVDYFSHGRHSLHAVWIKDDSNRIVAPEIALLQMKDPAMHIELFPCELCGICVLSEEDLRSHEKTEHVRSRNVASPSKSHSERKISVKETEHEEKRGSKSRSSVSPGNVYHDISAHRLESHLASEVSLNTVKESEHQDILLHGSRSCTQIKADPEKEQRTELQEKSTKLSKSRSDASDIEQKATTSNLAPVIVKQEKNVNNRGKTKIELSDSESDFEDVDDWSETDSLKDNRDLVLDLTDDNSNRQQFICSLCGSLKEVSDGGLGHYKDVHGIEIHNPKSAQVWPCIHCPSIYKTNQLLLEHLAAFHQVVEHWMCVFCDSVFVERRRFTLHVAEHLVMNPSSSHNRSRTSWICFQCDFGSKDPESILSHMNEQHLTEPVSLDLTTCPRCHTSELSTMIFDHLQRVCEACKERFCKSSDLIDHQVDVHGAKDNWKCVQCLMQLSNRSNLKRHIINLHAKERWPCRYCQEVAVSKDYLINHLINLHHKTEKQAKKIAVKEENILLL